MVSQWEQGEADINHIANGYYRAKWIFLFSQINNDKEHILKEIN